MRRSGRTGALLAAVSLLVAASLLPAKPAWGQDMAAAEALFNKGLADMKAGNFKDGCGALAESQRLDPRPGTLFTLAECRGREGAIATSVTLFEDYLQLYARLTPGEQFKQKARNKVAEERKAEFLPHVPKLTLRLPQGAPAGTEVIRDEVALKGASLGIPLPLDPGEHEVSTQAPGGPIHKETITIARDETKELVLTVLPVPPPEKPKVPVKEEASVRRPLAIVAGALGIVGLGVGGVTGALVLDRKGVADKNCPDLKCNLEGSNAVRDGRTLGLVSTVGFAVGGAGVVAAAILFLTEPKAAANKSAGGTGFRQGMPIVATDGHGAFVGATWQW